VLTLVHITFSCADPQPVAAFWADLLDYEPSASGDSWLAKDPGGEGPSLLFNRTSASA
jgi:hypothetical protein